MIDAIPRARPFALFAESFSTPLAVKVAATNPPNLRGLVICGAFIKNPVTDWLLRMKAFERPTVFRVPPPRFALEHFLIGAHAPRELRDAVCHALLSVPPDVVALRVRAVRPCDATEDPFGCESLPSTCGLSRTDCPGNSALRRFNG